MFRRLRGGKYTYSTLRERGTHKTLEVIPEMTTVVQRLAHSGA